MDAGALHEEIHAAIDSRIPVRTDEDFPSNYVAWEAGRMALLFWTDALVRDIERIQQLIDDGKTLEVSKDETLPLEDALVRADAASEKIRAILALALAVPAMVVKDNRLYFRPADVWDGVAARIRELAREDPDVARLARLYADLSDATEYRNQVCHSLSAVGNTYLAPFVGVYLDSELRQRDVLHQYLQPKGLVVEGEDIDGPTLRARALRTAEDALETLLQAGQLLATVIRRHGVLDCGPRVFFVEGPEGVRSLLDDPRR